MVRSRDSELAARTNELTPRSIQEALRMYFQPIKNDDPQVDFYTMYKRETVEYDTEYMQKYNEDLNTTLIFVRPSFPLIVIHADYDLRPVCSLQSVPPSSSMSSPSSSQTQANGRKPIFERFFSASIDPFLPTRILALLLRGADHPKRSSQPWTYCMQACSFRCWPRSSRC